MQRLFFYMVVWVLGVTASVSQQSFRFKHLTLDDGLPSNYISSIIQDAKGYLWFGTFNGLVKYDGYELTVYSHDPLDTNSLAHNEISALYQDSFGLIWVATNHGGLDRLNPYLLPTTFRHYPNAPLNRAGAASPPITNIFSGGEGDSAGFWVYASGKVFRFERNTEQFTSSDATTTPPLPVDSVSAQIARRLIEKKLYSSILSVSGPLLNMGIIHPVLAENTSSHIWLGTDGGGLYRFNKHTPLTAFGDDRIGGERPFTIFTHDPSNDESLSDNFVTALFQDRSNVLWVGTYRNGLNSYSKERDKFTPYFGNPRVPESFHDSYVRSLFVDKQGLIWIGGTTTGLTSYNRSTGEWKNFQHNERDQHSLLHNSVRAMYQDESGVLWIGTNRGLNRYDLRKNRFELLDSESNLMKESEVLSIVPDPDTSEGALWVATFTQGLFRIVPSQHKIESIPMNEDVRLGIYTLFFAGVDTLLIGTYGAGVFEFDTKSRTCSRQYSYTRTDTASLGSNIIMDIHRDSQNRIWIATDGGGLNLFDEQMQRFTRFTVKNGLPANTVLCILEDKRGNLWLSTVNGVSKFSPESRTFRNYTVADGLMSKEFNGHAGFKTTAGEMFFGGANGFISFFPDSVCDNPLPPQVMITGLLRNDTSLNIGKAIDEIHELEFSYSDKRITFEFAALHYTDPARNNYAYIMEGFEKHWTNCGARRSATYTNLDPGEYTFRVKASNCDGVWNEEGTSIRIIILPPYWNTWWFRMLATVSVIGGIGGVFRLLEKRKNAKRIQKLEQEQALERERLRISRDMHDDVGARLSELSMVSALATRSLDDAEETKKRLAQIGRTTEEIINSLDEIVWAVNPENDSLKDLADYLCRHCVEFLSNAQIPVKLEVPTLLPDIPLSVEIRHNIFMVVKESLNNIVKYAGATQVLFSLQCEENIIDCRINDNGIGFSPDVTRKFSYGLKNMQKRIEDLQGRFELTSHHDKGTQIRFTIPISTIKNRN